MKKELLYYRNLCEIYETKLSERMLSTDDEDTIRKARKKRRTRPVSYTHLTGPGMLTYELAQQACTVVSIEIDKRFVPLHNDLFSDLKTPPLILYEDARDVDEKRVFDTLLCKENNQSNLNSDAKCGVISQGGIPVKKIEPSSSSYDMKEEETIVHHPVSYTHLCQC